MDSRNERRTGLAARGLAASAMAAALIIPALGLATSGAPQDDARPSRKGSPAPSKVKLGLNLSGPGVTPGYTLLNPMNHKKAYLIDNAGRVVKTWESQYPSMHAAYLLENGHVFRIAALNGPDHKFGAGPGAAGRIQEFDWDGKLVWDYVFHNDEQYPHHDAHKMPNGHVLMVVWDKKTRDDAIASGRKPELVGEYILPDSVVEIEPDGPTGGKVVWEWHLWDHLIQDHDATKANYGDVGSHPELVDINFVDHPMGPGPGPIAKKSQRNRDRDSKKDARTKAEVEKLKTLGYVGSPRQRSQRVNPDWTHVNSVDYNPELDQIVVSVHELSEVWIIDHSTTTAEAAGHTGGHSGKGGDLLYRWGNPLAYRAGTKADQTLFAQHNANWIRPGLPGAGHLLVFNNGGQRPGGGYSSVDELVLPVDDRGHYTREPSKAFGPKTPVWSYSAPKKSDFYAFFISGAHRLPNGNTFICSGPNGTLFEVTPDKELVWKYVNPVEDGFGPHGRPGGPPQQQVIHQFVQSRLGLSDEQRKQIDALQKTVDDTLDKTLTDAQKKTLRERRGSGPGAFAAMPAPGKVMSLSTQVALKPTPEQRAKLTALQKTVDTTLGKILNADQADELKQMRTDFARGPFGRPGGPGGPRRKPGGPGGPGGPPPFGGGPPGGNGVFRAYKYTPDHPALAGKELKPGKTVEELQPKKKDADRPESKKETARR